MSIKSSSYFLFLTIVTPQPAFYPQNLKKKTSTTIPYNILVLATGAELVVPKISGIWQQGIYSLHNLEQAEAVKTELFHNGAQDVCIIGGGLIGTSMAESLIEPGS